MEEKITKEEKDRFYEVVLPLSTVEYVPIKISLLKDLKKLIDDLELDVESEYRGRDMDQLIKEGAIPDCYEKLVSIIEELKHINL